MNESFWIRMHGGSTHFPIALAMVSVLFDAASFVARNETSRQHLRTAGFYAIELAAMGSLGAVFSGLVLSKGVVLGTGLMARHHQFVWPAFALLIGAAVWRLIVRDRARPVFFKLYFAVTVVVAGLIAAAGFWGGEMLLSP